MTTGALPATAGRAWRAERPFPVGVLSIVVGLIVAYVPSQFTTDRSLNRRDEQNDDHLQFDWEHET